MHLYWLNLKFVNDDTDQQQQQQPKKIHTDVSKIFDRNIDHSIVQCTTNQ